MWCSFQGATFSNVYSFGLNFTVRESFVSRFLISAFTRPMRSPPGPELCSRTAPPLALDEELALDPRVELVDEGVQVLVGRPGLVGRLDVRHRAARHRLERIDVR